MLGYRNGMIAIWSKWVTLSALVRSATRPGQVNVRSVAAKSSWPLRVTVNLSPSARNPSTCHVSGGILGDTPSI